MIAFDRRTLLMCIAAAVATATAPRAFADPLPAAHLPAPNGVLSRLPADSGNSLALTVDGVSTEVVGAFAQFCRDSAARLTFFVNGANASWATNAPAIRAMVESGQIQVANHTWSHPYITKLTLPEVADQIKRNADFPQNTYGVDGTPYFRPPYGLHNPDTDRVAADLGYHTVTLWSGTVGDSRPITEDGLIAALQGRSRPNRSCWPTRTCPRLPTPTTRCSTSSVAAICKPLR